LRQRRCAGLRGRCAVSRHRACDVFCSAMTPVLRRWPKQNVAIRSGHICPLTKTMGHQNKFVNRTRHAVACAWLNSRIGWFTNEYLLRMVQAGSATFCRQFAVDGNARYKKSLAIFIEFINDKKNLAAIRHWLSSPADVTRCGDARPDRVCAQALRHGTAAGPRARGRAATTCGRSRKGVETLVTDRFRGGDDCRAPSGPYWRVTRSAGSAIAPRWSGTLHGRFSADSRR
jgi:hypothetical protein